MAGRSPIMEQTRKSRASLSLACSHVRQWDYYIYCALRARDAAENELRWFQRLMVPYQAGAL